MSFCKRELFCSGVVRTGSLLAMVLSLAVAGTTAQADGTPQPPPSGMPPASSAAEVPQPAPKVESAEPAPAANTPAPAAQDQPAQGQPVPAKPAAPATPPAAAKPAPAKPAAPKPATVADCILNRTNAIRRQYRMRDLTSDARLQAAAQGLANHMAATGAFSHNADGRSPAMRVAAQRYSYRYVAENIVYRTGVSANNDETARMLMDQWMNSPGHRQNILGGQTSQIGVATAVSRNGAVYAVQVFAAPGY